MTTPRLKNQAGGMIGMDDREALARLLLEPFDPQKHTPQDMGLGGLSTEYLSTDFDPEHVQFSDLGDPEGLAFNFPTIWFGEDGSPVYLEDPRRAMAQALAYEERVGRQFPRFPDLNSAVEAARERSQMGGASKVPLIDSQFFPMP